MKLGAAEAIQSLTQVRQESLVKEQRVQVDKTIKETNGDSAEFSLEAIKRLKESEAIDNKKSEDVETKGIIDPKNGILSPTQTQMLFERKAETENVVVVFKDKESGETVAEMPSEYAIKNTNRINGFLDRIIEDIKK